MNWISLCIFVWSAFIFGCAHCQQYSVEDIDALIDLYYKNEEERLKKIVPPFTPDPKLDIITASITVDSLFRDRRLEKEVFDISLQQRLFEFVADKISFFDKTDVEKQELLKLLESSASYREQVSQCQKEIIKPQCDAEYPYRTFDGTCNNLKHPLWGSTQQCARRFLPQYYEGSSQIRKAVSGEDLPNPRILSIFLSPEADRPHFTSLSFNFFGEAVSQDVSLSPSQILNGNIDCCATPSLEECFPILYPPSDTVFRSLNVTCQNVIRVGPCRTCSIGKRQQIMQVTAALDASFLYGNFEGKARSLRKFDGTGQLHSRRMKAGEMLSQNKEVNVPFCPKYKLPKCFLSGDDRVNQNTFIAMVHTIFHRFHNKLVTELHTLNPLWDDEKLYQEGRRILVAIYQNIVYKELVPILMEFNWQMMTDFDLWVSTKRSKYDETVNFGTYSEFGGASFRLHSMLSNDVLIDGMKMERFRDIHANPDLIYEGYMDKTVVGLSKLATQTFDRFMSKDGSQTTNKEPRNVLGVDVQSRDIQRGRDLGFQPYIEYVKICSNGTIQIESFEDLATYNLAPIEDVKLLQKHYGSVDDIDLIVGLQFDSNLSIFRCINAHQFRNYKSGDRFFFTHGNLPTSFKYDQLEELLKTTFASVICSTTNISETQKYVLMLPSAANPIVPCAEIRKLNLIHWKE